jgi:hypothetical protein
MRRIILGRENMQNMIGPSARNALWQLIDWIRL